MTRKYAHAIVQSSSGDVPFGLLLLLIDTVLSYPNKLLKNYSLIHQFKPESCNFVLTKFLSNCYGTHGTPGNFRKLLIALSICPNSVHGNVTSAGWQVTLRDPIWHVSSRSGEPSFKLLYSVLLVFTKANVARLPWHSKTRWKVTWPVTWPSTKSDHSKKRLDWFKTADVFLQVSFSPSVRNAARSFFNSTHR